MGTEGVDAGFDHELAHEAKDAGTASETESQPEKWVFLCFCSKTSLWAMAEQRHNVPGLSRGGFLDFLSKNQPLVIVIVIVIVDFL